MKSSKDLKAMGAALRAARVERGISQIAMAKTIGISNKQLCNIEKGNNWPSLQVYSAICTKVFGAKLPLFPGHEG